MGLGEIPDKTLDRVLGWFEGIWARLWARWTGIREARWQRVVVSQPVANPDVFEGREDGLARLNDLFAKRNVVWITGPPGIGKTWLAGRFLRNAGLADDSRSFDLGPDSELQDLLESLNAFLLEKKCDNFDAKFKQPGLEPNQRIPALLHALAQTRFVLVIESYEEAGDEEGIAALLQQAEEHLAGAKLIVTSQEPPRWSIEERRVPLGGLHPEESRRLLEALGVAERWREIHDAVDGCPKGLRVAAGLAKRYGVDEAVEAAGRGEPPALGLFGEVYARVTEPARRMWVMLTMLPGPFHRETVLEIWREDSGAGAWAELVDCSVLDPRGDRWQIHSLARATSGKEWYGQRRWQKQYGRRFATFYAQFAKDNAQDRTAIEAELENLLAAARLAFQYRQWKALWGMGYALDDPLEYAGRWTAREELLRLCADGAARARDKETLSTFAHNLGTVLQARGNLEEAEDLYRQSLEINQGLGDRPGEAKTLHQLGMVAQHRGKLPEAEDLYRQSLEIEREVGNQLGIAQSLHQLGKVAHQRGKLAEAVERIEEAYQMLTEMGLAEVEQAKGDLDRLRKRLAEEGGAGPAG